MRRSADQAFADLRRHLEDWKQAGAKPGLRIFVYPPEGEPRMLARFPLFAKEIGSTVPISIVDVGQEFLAELERRNGLVDRLTRLEHEGTERLLRDLGELAHRYLTRLLATPLDPPALVRLLVNTGALGTFVSYSAITNALHGDGPARTVAALTVIAFPGEGDERQLNLLGLRADTNYRVPRI
ncbi:MAG TPA: hypothetical protein VMW65_07355 [Chloroflexota bacterium]|nr:hypothetical protein [Chloroflexota bacterium]